MPNLTELNANPFRFQRGEIVYLAGHPQFEATITAAFGHGRLAWPHYLVMDYQGDEWTMPQQLLSRSPILP